MVNMPKFKSGITHSGPFHADDVFAGALLRILYGNDFGIKRLNNHELTDEMFKDPEIIIFDIGGNRTPFDHHYSGSPVRGNGIPYSSFGLIWAKLASYKYSATLLSKVDEKLVMGIDAADCGVNRQVSLYDTYNVVDLIGHMTPLWTESSSPSDFNRLYEQAVTFAKRVLLRLIDFEQSKIDAFVIVKRAFEDAIRGSSQIMILNRAVPWKSHLFDLEQNYYARYNKFIKYVIHPSARGGYKVISVPINSPDDKENRAKFPIEWHVDCKLASPDAIFVHQYGFCGDAHTLDGAKEMAMNGLKYHGFIN